MMTLNEKKGTTVKPKWIFEIFHDKFVHGICQTYEGGFDDSPVTVGCTELLYRTSVTESKSERIELMDGEQVTKVSFSGLD